jgi:thiamine pyrophosphate-dependent acetolactate synthase large subunit-like protein
MATAVATAKTDGSPVLVMTGEVPLDMEGRGVFQDASQATLTTRPSWRRSRACPRRSAAART